MKSTAPDRKVQTAALVKARASAPDISEWKKGDIDDALRSADTIELEADLCEQLTDEGIDSRLAYLIVRIALGRSIKSCADALDVCPTTLRDEVRTALRRQGESIDDIRARTLVMILRRKMIQAATVYDPAAVAEADMSKIPDNIQRLHDVCRESRLGGGAGEGGESEIDILIKAKAASAGKTTITIERDNRNEKVIEAEAEDSDKPA